MSAYQSLTTSMPKLVAHLIRHTLGFKILSTTIKRDFMIFSEQSNASLSLQYRGADREAESILEKMTKEGHTYNKLSL